MISEIKNIVDSIMPVSLGGIDKVKLMDRIDTKYILAANRIPDLLKMMHENYKVLEINSFRIPLYETVYLDTPDFDFFNQHVTGRTERIKVRFRKYESNRIRFLEIKKKTKKGRTVKWRIEDNSQADCCDDSSVNFLDKHIPFDPELLRPVLASSFKRITLAGLITPERITIDLDLSYSLPGIKGRELPLIAVIELKSDGLAVKSPFSKIIKQLSVQPTGFSKYCTGLAMLYDLPRMNMLKPKILLLNRIENEYNGALSA